ncbi:SDR family NAD(P)-dependent oxidoreductase [Rhodococcus sp. NPDC127530]|uniref:SDR family NAD(P)-dependent oxidoreductase n=1 Tax=unclassified Rhodococcus (in: high G+C Gram-positive bacteria) TaxID=192944 RepID=UPI0036308037
MSVDLRTPVQPRAVQRKTALVTGAESVLSRDIACALARDGITVAVQGYSPAHVDETVQTITDDGGSALAVGSDLTVESEVDQAFNRIEERGPIDLLVNNASLPGPESATRPFLEVRSQDWRRFTQDNLLVLHLISHRVARTLKQARRRGAVVTVFGENEAARSDHAHHFLRAIVGAFTRGVADDLMRNNICVNAVRAGANTDPQLTTAMALDLLQKRIRARGRHRLHGRGHP